MSEADFLPYFPFSQLALSRLCASSLLSQFYVRLFDRYSLCACFLVDSNDVCLIAIVVVALRLASADTIGQTRGFGTSLHARRMSNSCYMFYLQVLPSGQMYISPGSVMVPMP